MVKNIRPLSQLSALNSCFSAYSLRLTAYGLLMILLIFHGISSAIDVYDIGGSARAIGMGRAYNSEEQRADTIFYNPAGTADMKDAELTTMFGQLSGDVNYTLLGGVCPTKWGILGLGYASSSTGYLMSTTIEASGRVGALSPFSFNDNIIMLTYGNSIYREKMRDNISYGFGLKFYNKSAGDISGSGTALDFGGAYEANERLRSSILLKNIIAIPISWNKASAEAITKGIRFGFKYLIRENMDIFGDLTNNFGTPFEAHLGSEYKMKNNLAFRLGCELKPIDNSQKYLNLTVGLGYKIRNFNIDYAYYYDTLYTYNSRQFVSIAMQIPLPKPKPIINEYFGIPQATPVLKIPSMRIPGKTSGADILIKSTVEAKSVIKPVPHLKIPTMIIPGKTMMPQNVPPKR